MIRTITRLLRPSARTSALAALSAAALLVPAATPATAHGGAVAAGHGTYLAADQTTTLGFTFVVHEAHDGSIQGYALWKGPLSTTLWEVSSLMHVGEMVLFAGEIVGTTGTPPPGHAVGVTAATAVHDNGPGFMDDIASISVVPPEFGNPTIQQLVALFGPPPPQAFRPLLSGNIWTQ